jgi:spore maturation protein CgeB
MKILSCVPYHYYHHPKAIEPNFYNFTHIPEQMGHCVHTFDFIEQCHINKERMNNFFLSIVKNGSYDLTMITSNKEEFFPEVLSEASRYSVLMAWNSDDDWRWEDYSLKWCKYYTYMVTTYRHIYEANKLLYPNLLLSQWGCLGVSDGLTVNKDLDLSFVGQIYGDRGDRIAFIRKRMPIAVFGKGTDLPLNWKSFAKKQLAKLFGIPFQVDRTLNLFSEVNNIWNRSKISFTPLQSSHLSMLQIKGRVFDMGLSGTVMLCDRNPSLYEFYEPGKEYVEFSDMKECVERARYLLSHDAERQKIAEAYYRRTQSEHMWRHRFEKLFTAMGLPAYGNVV